MLLVSHTYLALDEIYHPLCAPIPRSVTLRLLAELEGLQTTQGTVTLDDALFQETYACAANGKTSKDYKSRPKGLIFMLSSSLVIRHY